LRTWEERRWRRQQVGSNPVNASCDDVLTQIEFQRSGRYQDPDEYTLD
jgi:hypothetical protein